MAHKLAEVWSVQLLTSRGFIEDGKMDLTSMDDEGNLDEGEHDHDASFKEKIKGNAKLIRTPIGETYAISIRTKDTERASYEGLLVSDSGGNMVIVGGFRFKRGQKFEGREERELSEEIKFLLAQDEGVWVITKP